MLQLCCGASQEEAQRYRLPPNPLQAFSYLRASGCTRIAGLNDAQEFFGVRNAMESVGLTRDDQHQARSKCLPPPHLPHSPPFPSLPPPRRQ